MPVLSEGQVQIATIVDSEIAAEYTRVADERRLSRAAFLRELLDRGWKDYQREQEILRSLQGARGV